MSESAAKTENLPSLQPETNIEQSVSHLKNLDEKASVAFLLDKERQRETLAEAMTRITIETEAEFSAFWGDGINFLRIIGRAVIFSDYALVRDDGSVKNNWKFRASCKGCQSVLINDPVRSLADIGASLSKKSKLLFCSGCLDYIEKRRIRVEREDSPAGGKL